MAKKKAAEVTQIAPGGGIAGESFFDTSSPGRAKGCPECHKFNANRADKCKNCGHTFEKKARTKAAAPKAARKARTPRLVSAQGGIGIGNGQAIQAAVELIKATGSLEAAAETLLSLSALKGLL